MDRCALLTTAYLHTTLREFRITFLKWYIALSTANTLGTVALLQLLS